MIMENEIWKTINDFDGLYEVSNFGRVKSLQQFHGTTERILKPFLNKWGYYRVSLRKSNKYYKKSVHRLVAEAFLPNPNNLPEVNHINEVKTDNRVENLCWVSSKENCNYGSRNARILQKNKENGLYVRLKTFIKTMKSKPVIQCDLQGNVLKEWESGMEIERQLGYSFSNICNCCLGKPHHNTAYGYKWHYKQTENK